MRPRFLNMLRGALILTSIALTTPGAEAMDSKPGAILPDQASQDLLAATSGTGNNLVSPASLYTAIGMTRAGLSEAETPGFAQPAMSEGPLRIANAVWTAEEVTLSDDARRRLKDTWNAAFGTLVPGADAAPRINEWVADATDGKIDQLFDGPLDDAAVAILNAISFEDNWATPFPAEATRDHTFHLAKVDGSEDELVTVPFLSSTAKHPCWDVEGGRVVKLEFAEDGRYLLLFLPRAELAPDEISLQAGARLELEEARWVQVEIPRLDLAANHDLGPALDALGLIETIHEGLVALDNPAPRLGPVAQAVRFRADETGASAAAATAVIGVRSLGPPVQVVTFDRPFDFFLIDPTIPRTLMAGRVKDPR